MRKVVLAIGGAVLFVAFPAAANGRFPQSDQLVFSPNDRNLIVLRTTYGILPSHDNGSTWSFVCEDALAIDTATALVDPPLGLTENNALSVGGPAGLNVSTDVGCNWNCIRGPLDHQTVVDLAVRPDAPSQEVALTATYVTSDSAQANVYAQVFETVDNGVSWTPIGASIDPRVLPTTVEVSQAAADRLYVSGTRDFGMAASLFVFDKGKTGQSWTEWVLPKAQFDGTQEDSIYVSGVDPTNADRIYIRSRSRDTGGVSRLTVVTLPPDGGVPRFSTARTFTVPPPPPGVPRYVGEMAGFALSADGSKVYIGSNEEGLWVAPTSTMVFEKTSSIEVQCLATRGSELWACSAAKDQFIAGVSMDDGRTFTPKLRLIGDLTGPIACAPNKEGAACAEDANSSQCLGPYDTFCATYPCDRDAATGPAPAPAPSPAASPSSSCACDLANGGDGGAAALASGLAIVGFALRRRRKAR